MPRGLMAMVVGCLFSALMGVPIYLAHQRDPSLSPLWACFIRVVTASIPILGWEIYRRGGPLPFLRTGRKELWSYGALGAVTVSLFFLALPRIGMGEVGFLYAANSVFIVMLQPWFIGIPVSRKEWVAALGGFVGLWLLAAAQGSHATTGWTLWLGRAFAIGSGLAAAFAYLILGRLGPSVPPTRVMAFWCLSCLLFLSAWLGISGAPMPTSPEVWLLLVAGGVSATLSGVFIVTAFQTAAPAPIAAVSYLAPLLGLGLDWIVFSPRVGAQALVGCLLILICGGVLPFLKDRSMPRLARIYNGRRRNTLSGSERMTSITQRQKHGT